jgi:hypothetical protein
MKTLTPREIGTIRAALALWVRAGETSPAIADTASGSGQFEPLALHEVAVLSRVLQQSPRVSVQPIDDSALQLLRDFAAADEHWFETDDERVMELMDRAAAIVEAYDGGE